MGRQLPTSRKTPPLRQPCGHLDLRHPASKLRQQTPAVSAPDPRLRHLCGAQAKGKVLQRKVHLWSRPGGKPLGQDQGRGRQAETHRSTSHPAESSGPGYMGSYTLGAEREPPAGVMRAPRGAPQRGRDLEKVGQWGGQLGEDRTARGLCRRPAGGPQVPGLCDSDRLWQGRKWPLPAARHRSAKEDLLSGLSPVQA